MAGKMNFPNSDVVMATGEAPQPTKVKLSERAGKITVSGDDIKGTIILTGVDWHPDIVRYGEWTSQHYDAEGKKVGSGTSGRLTTSTDKDAMIRLCLDRIFGAGKWVLKKGRK